MSDLTAYPCPVCQIGFCHPGQKPYLHVHKGMLISAPDMLVWTCDICQNEEFDRDALTRLEKLLGLSEATLDPQRTSIKMQNPEPNDTTTARRAKP